MGSIGDVARALPLASELKRYSPQIKITWVVEPKSADLVKLSTAVDRVVVFERGKGITALVRAIKQIREGRYDLVLDLQRHFKSGLFALLSRGKVRIGFNRRNSKEFNWLFQNKSIPFREETDSKLLHYLEFTKLLGISTSFPPEFSLRKPALSHSLNAKLNFSEKPAVGLILNSSWTSKDWLPEGYQKLIKMIAAQGDTRIMLLGDHTKQSLSQKLVQNIPQEIIVNLVGQTTLAELISVLANLNAVVGPDTGPGHIAAAFGVPYVTLVGPTDPGRITPLGMEEFVVKASVPCSPCMRKRCPGLGTVCMKLISPELVFVKLKMALSQALSSPKSATIR